MESDQETSSSSAYKAVGLLLAAALIVAAVLLFRAYAPKLRGPTPGEALRAALEAQLPGSQPRVLLDADVLKVTLDVPYDPTIDAQLAQGTFQTALAVANAQSLKGFTGVEIFLRGTSIEGQATSASRTFDYGPRPAD